jgi:hypothetical protein
LAISETHYRLLRELRERDLLPQGGRILEVGAANWYGDADPKIISKDMDEICPFAVVRQLYKTLFASTEIVSIDTDPAAPGAFPHDLNVLACGSGDRYDVSFNHGTAEHIFNIANVFRVMHDATVEGGLMIHEAPFTGWIDHGF